MSITTPTSIPGFAGELVRPGDDGYDRHRAVWNAMADRRPSAHRPMHERGRCRRGGALRPGARPRDRGALWRPRHPGVRGARAGADDRPDAHGRGPGGPRCATGVRGWWGAAGHARPGDRAVRPRHDRRQHLAYGGRRADAGRRDGLAGAPARAVVRQRRDLHRRDRDRRDPARVRDRAPGPVLGAAGRGRELRRGDRVRVPAASHQPRGADGGPAVRRGRCHGAPPTLERPPGRGAPRGQPDRGCLHRA